MIIYPIDLNAGMQLTRRIRMLGREGEKTEKEGMTYHEVSVANFHRATDDTDEVNGVG